MASHAKATQKKTSMKPSQRSLKASNSVQNKMGCKIYTSRCCKSISKGDAVVTETNYILGLPLTVSTQRLEPITPRVIVSDEALVLAKSRSEEGSREAEDLTLKSHKEGLFLKNIVPKTQEHPFLRKLG